MSSPCKIPFELQGDQYRLEGETNLYLVKRGISILHCPYLGPVWIVASPKHGGLCETGLNLDL